MFETLITDKVWKGRALQYKPEARASESANALKYSLAGASGLYMCNFKNYNPGLSTRALSIVTKREKLLQNGRAKTFFQSAFDLQE